ncbi:MAG: GspH/FimT family pseudopilin [Usitatibacter sp.]
MRSPSSSRGFSMVEIAVALAIVAMMMVLVAPSMTTWIQNTRLRSAAESVATGLQTARIEAMKRNTLVSFQMTDANSSAWTVCLYNPVTDTCSAAAGSVIASRGASEDNSTATLGTDTTLSDTTIAISPGTNVPSSTTFDSFGRLAATAPSNVMRIDVRNAALDFSVERRMVILINLGGQVRMCDPKLVKATNPQGCA